MVGDVGPVGPFPEGVDPAEYDRRRRRILWSMPSGLYLLGSASGGRRNLMTLNWATQVAASPKLVLVSVECGALTHELVAASGAFTLNVLRREDRPVVRKFAKPAVDDGATLAGLAVRASPGGLPILEQAMAWLECRVRTQLSFDSHTAFVGEVADCGGEHPDGEVLRMEDTRMNYGG